MEHPRLRPFLTVARDPRAPDQVLLFDQLGFCTGPLRFSGAEAYCVELLHGGQSLHAIHERARREVPDPVITLTFLEALVRRLEAALLLDGPSFRAQVEDPVRAPRCIGCYPGDPGALREYLNDMFNCPGGAGLPGNVKPQARLRAVLAPHIDYPRGGTCYTWAFRELVEQSGASLFFVIGTSHYSTHRFTLTRKHFQTPLGVTPTDQDVVERLVHHYGPGLFDDEWQAHLPEHSIELEVVFLQYLFEQRRPIRIVPLVVGSFADCVRDGVCPSRYADVARMIAALHRVEAELNEPACYVISGDLAHIGPKFHDPGPVTRPWLAESKRRDLALIRAAERCDTDGYYRLIAGEGDARRICGLPPTFVALRAARPGRGRFLDYGQYVEPRGQESVSFASMAFYQ